MKKLHIALVCAAVGICSAGSLVVNATSHDNFGRQNELVLEECLVLPQDMIDVPAKEKGQLVATEVVEGEYIEANRAIALVDDQRAKLDLSAANVQADASQQKANDETPILEAEAALRVAASDMERTKRLNELAHVTDQDVEHSILQHELAQLQLSKRKKEQELAGLDAKVDTAKVEAAQAIVNRHVIRAPFAGNVFRFYKNRGEWVDVGEPVLQMARMDVLRVEGQIDGTRYNPEEIMGKQVTVSVERARGEIRQFNGRIVFVDLRQSSLRRYQVRAEVENQQANGFWLLNPGADAKMTIHIR